MGAWGAFCGGADYVSRLISVPRLAVTENVALSITYDREIRPRTQRGALLRERAPNLIIS